MKWDGHVFVGDDAPSEPGLDLFLKQGVTEVGYREWLVLLGCGAVAKTEDVAEFREAS